MTPARTPQPAVDGGNANAVLGKSVTIKGQIVGREDLIIDGEVEGDIDMSNHRLTVGPAASVRAGIKARELVVYGAVNGKVETTEKTDIRTQGSIVGDVKTARIAIQDGAYLKGAVDITGVAAARPKTTAPPSGD
jgi:cytoskeletal protein CcmA (bactofilin family)